MGEWSPRQVARAWAIGLAIEAALLLVMFTLLVRPEPPLVDRLRGDTAGLRSVQAFTVDTIRSGDARAARAPHRAAEDSFYTVLHWPLTTPLERGGGRVIAMPFHLWWVPALYVCAVPLALVVLLVTWLWQRRGRAPTVA